MASTFSHTFLVALLASGLLLTGCPAPSVPVAKTKPEAKKPEHDHDHEHSHKGPHGGKIAVVGDEKFHVEWTHSDDTGKVAIYVLDADAKKEVPVAAEKIVVVVKQADKSTDYELAAVDPVDGKSAKFEVTEQALLGTLEALSEKITAEIKELEINGTKFANVKLVEDEHHHH